MKLHRAALTMVAWYLLMAPTFRDPQTNSFRIDLNAPLSAWEFVSSYYSANDCGFAQRDLDETSAQYLNVIGFYTLCIASDDPRLSGR
jgi:hypothetical protein